MPGRLLLFSAARFAGVDAYVVDHIDLGGVAIETDAEDPYHTPPGPRAIAVRMVPATGLKANQLGKSRAIDGDFV